MRVKINIDIKFAELPKTMANNIKIAAALVAANGAARAHTYVAVSEIRGIAQDAEARLEKLGIPKRDRAGASIRSESGEKLPSAYKYQARTTVVYLERGSSHWYLIKARESSIWPGQRPTTDLHLTAMQDQTAIRAFRNWQVPTCWPMTAADLGL